MPATPTDLARTIVTPADWLPGYEIREVIGSGGCGTVYKARQLKLGRDVALKVIQFGPCPALAARFETEAAALAKLSHPNVVQVYDCGWHAGRAFMAMELLDGEDLARLLRRV